MQEALNKQYVRKDLEKFFKDRLTGNVTDYSARSAKDEGVTEGFVGGRDGDQYMVKGSSDKPLNDEYLLREFVSAPLFKRLLYNRAPVIGIDQREHGGIDPEEPEKQIYLRSQYLGGFETIGAAEARRDKGEVAAGQTLKETVGLEKVVAACMFLGDVDINKGNLGIMPTVDGPVAAKIDHGQAFSIQNIPENSLRGLTGHLIKELGYSKDFNFSLDEFAQAVGQITKISDEEIDQLVGTQMYKLKQAGFDFDEIVDYYADADTPHDASPEEIVENYFRKYVKAQAETFKELEKTLEVIKLIGPVDDKWKGNDWIHEIQDKDPVIWAMENDKTINGMDPLKWAIKNHRDIEGQNVLNWAIENDKSIDGMDPVTWLVKNGKVNTEQERQEIVDNILEAYLEADGEIKQDYIAVIQDIIEKQENKALVDQLVAKMTDPVFLEELLNEYMEMDAGKEKEDLAALYKQVITHGRDKSEVLGPDSDLYDILSHPNTVARLVDEYSKGANSKGHNALENLTPEVLMKNCTPELLEKIADLGDKLGIRDDTKGTGLMQWIKDVLNSINNYFRSNDDKITSEKFSNAMQELDSLSQGQEKDRGRGHDVPPKGREPNSVEQEKGVEIESIGKFTRKIAQERAAMESGRARGG